MQIDVEFPGGKSVAARFKGHTVVTDQPQSQGGGDSAPSPFDLFLSSIATCMGYYALEFCLARGLDTEGMVLELDSERDRETGLHQRIRVELRLPGKFPPRYEKAVLRAMDQCTVKRHLQHPPEFEVGATIAEVVLSER